MNLISSNQDPDDKSIETALRPSSWGDYIGQEIAKRNLSILIQAAKGRKESVEHLFFYGPPGLGKTTLAHLVAKEMDAQIKVTSGPAIERVGDLASLLTNLSPGDVLFIDEAHRLNKAIEEVLYPALENRTIDIIIGKGPGARSIQLDLPPFTLIAATTRASLISAPLRSRFSGGSFRLDFYNENELKEIIKKSSSVLSVDLKADAAEYIAARSRATPRIANRLLKRARDYAQVHGSASIDLDVAKKTLELIGIDHKGLDEADRRILSAIVDKFGGGPVGLQTIAAATSEENATIEEVNEPYLLRIGFIKRTPRGRVATRSAWEYLGKEAPRDLELFS
ncbi:MAG: Holliday junction branch migration DNA helicase RuvB [Candidatus Niyogibacteria bacterium CG10_big_fil_rev_8_21_14_0_10_42_19]|uniref:Holliday junction branch migration complex subunit RuvB n=1 Tax=Candidatus Niyogibacteria bacterium CG10_big_fil_rev_8_21_14_0_10_42_19 TaxID=1974725 RepID=A0A2H0TF46_9BACT|nr:MAG: Holliday junction branch migration DNA helicase RuvB [Candidatus Niyogibacteria bacterium CG10_big_fil_rev_8_21_14_0_10_42_19]